MNEDSQLSINANEYSPDTLSIYKPRPRRSNDAVDDEDDFDVDRYDRADPCVGMKQIQTGFKKWAHRFIGGCGGQVNKQHQARRAEKFYNIFTSGLGCINPAPLWKAPKSG